MCIAHVLGNRDTDLNANTYYSILQRMLLHYVTEKHYRYIV